LSRRSLGEDGSADFQIGTARQTEFLENKTGDPNFRIAGQTFSPPTTRIAPEFSHSLAIC
jgi:hypothetical protein